MLIVADSKIPNTALACKQFGDVRALPTPEINTETLKDADVLFVRSETRVDEALLKGSRVRFVGTATIGVDHVDLEYLERSGIAFASCPGSNANSVAEYVLAALLELSEHLNFPLAGKTLGIVGHGNTGSRTANKAAALGMHVLLNDPPLARSTNDARYLPLDALMEADIISLHVPLTRTGTDATFHLFDAERLTMMKAGSILINTSRGSVVETNALKDALQTNRLQACVLDVWEREPNIDVELLQLATIGTPHIAGYSYDGKVNATTMLLNALSRFLGVPLQDSEEPAERPMQLRVGGTQPISSAVQQCYDIRVDDMKLRRSLAMTAENRASHFRQLRATYPQRREFHNYAIKKNSTDDWSAMVLQSLGFVVE
jgi:erythronate-4-phosphate dehydrogenase